MDGRDIGTVVLPDADLKVYLVASEDVRAERRFKELKEKGQDVTLEKIKEELSERDYRDMHRENSPLKKASDAVEVDSSKMSVEEVVDKINELFTRKVGKKK
jgi:cytidylate kinase